MYFVAYKFTLIKTNTRNSFFVIRRMMFMGMSQSVGSVA